MPSDRAVRLHPTSLVFGTLRNARQFLIPAVAVVLFSRGNSWEAWLGVLFVIAVIREVFRYFTLRYTLDEDELVVHEGLIFRTERHVPYARIQNVDVVQSPLHRPLGVGEVRIETGSGARPEAVLRVLRLDAVDHIRARVFGRDPSHAPADDDAAESKPSSERTMIALGGAELLKVGLLSNRAMPLIAVALGLMWEFDLWERVEVARPLVDWASNLPALSASLLLLMVIGMALALYLLLSVVWTTVWLYGFRLKRVGDDFRVECGLLTRVTGTVPLRRVQVLVIDQSPLQRLMRRVSIRVATAGGTSESEDQTNLVRRRWFVPLMPEEGVQPLLDEMVPGLKLDGLAWQPLAPGARRRIFVRWLLLLVPIAAFGTLAGWLADQSVMEWIAPAALVGALPLAWWHASRRTKIDAVAQTDRSIVVRRGVWPQSWCITSPEKVQVVTVSETPFDRRRAMATLSIDTASASLAAEPIRTRYLPRGVAHRLRRDVRARARRTQYRW